MIKKIILTCLFLIICPLTAFAEPIIKDIIIQGNIRVETSTVLTSIKSQKGKELDRSRVKADIKELYREGFFDTIDADAVAIDGNKVNLVFIVKEKPAIRRLVFEGNKEVDQDKLKEKFNLKTRYFYDSNKIATGVSELKKYYEEEGYYETEILVDPEVVGENQVDLKIKITEGERRKIRVVEFQGNNQVDSSELSSLVDTSRYKWWSSWITGSGVVKQESLDNDIREINKYYLNNGFVNVKVAQPDIVQIDNGIKVVFKIEEGEVHEFGRISARGDLKDNSINATLDGIKIKQGEKFNLEQLKKDTFTVAEKFTDVGYAFANVEPATQVNKEEKTVDIVFVVDKGKPVKVNRINISGNKKTKDNVIRRSLQISEQEVFSSSKVKRSQELLQRLGYFEEVSIVPEPSENKDEVDLGVNVKEGNTGSFSLGAGISSGDGFIFSSRISENNLFGTGNSLSLDLNTGTERQNYVLSFNNPRVYDTRMSLGVDLLSVKRKFDKFDRNQTGGSVTVGFPLLFLGEDLADDIRLSFTYELLQIDIANVDADAPTLVQNNKGSSVSSSITPQLIRNTIDNPLDPSKGSKQQLSLELAGLGGEEKFWLSQFANTYYVPIWKSSFGNFVFSQRTRVGYGESYNSDDFPLFKRFFPGGINSVRGFASRELGPKDVEGNEYGGNKQLVANFELIYPLVNSAGLSGVFFYDAGNAFDDNESIDISGLRHAIGWGIRWRSPIAPIRLEFGYPLDKQEGDDAYQVNFSFGAPS